MKKNNLGYFPSVKQAQAALDFLSYFPGIGGKKGFRIGKCEVSGFPSLEWSYPGKGMSAMGVAELQGAVRAWRRLKLP